MARIAGVNIPTNKRVLIALQYIHGIGDRFAGEICEKVGIPAERRVNELSDSFTLVNTLNTTGAFRRARRDRESGW